MKYSDKLQDPRWQKKRLEIFERDDFTCQHCYDESKTLNVHHITYSSGEPWDIENDLLITLCKECHETETQGLKDAWITIQNSLKSKGFTAAHIHYLSIFLDRVDIKVKPNNVKDIFARMKNNEAEIEENLRSILKHF